MAEQDLNTIAFPAFDAAQMAKIERYANGPPKKFKAGQALFRVGDRDAKFFVIKSGEVEIVDESGDKPKTIMAVGEIEKDERNFVRTGLDMANSPQWKLKRQPFLLETSRPGVFAAGDVRSGSVKRVASAVGEGAMSVQFVHEFLKTM